MSWWARSLNWILSPWPRRWVRSLGTPLGWLWFDVFRFRRHVVLENLRYAFPDWPIEKRVQVGRRSVCVLTENFAEFFLIPSINESWISQECVFHHEPHLQEALQKNRGVLLLTLHLGHGDVLANVMARKGYFVHVITKFFRSSWLNKIWFAVRGAQGVHFIEPHGERTPFAILKALKNQGLVAFVLDQHMGRPYGLETRFFDRPAGTAYGLALFHLKTKSPVLPIYSYEGPDQKIHVVFDKPFFYDEALGAESDRDRVLSVLTQKFTDKIEEIVRQYPDQWMWIHRRWKWKGTKPS